MADALNHASQTLLDAFLTMDPHSKGKCVLILEATYTLSSKSQGVMLNTDVFSVGSKGRLRAQQLSRSG